MSLSPLTSEVNNIDYLITMTPVRSDIIYLASEQSMVEIDVLEAGKMDKCTDLNDRDPTPMGRRLGHRVQRRQVVWGVPRMHRKWSKEGQLVTGNRVKAR